MEKIVKTQKQLDKIKEDFDGIIKIVGDGIVVSKRYKYYVMAWANSTVTACDNSTVKAWDNSTVTAWDNSTVTAWNNSTVTACDNSTVTACDNSTVTAWHNSTVTACDNSTVTAWNNNTVTACDNSTVTAWNNSTVTAWHNSTVTACDNSTVTAWGNSTVTARDNSTVKAWDNSTVKAWDNVGVYINSKYTSVDLNGYSVAWLLAEGKVKKGKNCTIVTPKYKEGTTEWLGREGIKDTQKVTLFKRVSEDFKTQENTPNETVWEIGTTLTHKNWNPKEDECGAGKFHACSTPFFCDEFRSGVGDKYIAIQIDKKDLYAWKNPQYPHKIAFRKGKVLYQCDCFGNKLKAEK